MKTQFYGSFSSEARLVIRLPSNGSTMRVATMTGSLTGSKAKDVKKENCSEGVFFSYKMSMLKEFLINKSP